MSNSQAESQSKFPFTLAEVLFTEMYGDRSNQTANSDGEKLNRGIEADRKMNCPGLILSDGWFTAEEQKDWEAKKKASNEIVPIIYQAIHHRANDLDKPEPRSALCLSGGGIRSATFNLGVLQGLARNQLLDKFDYLSTVSGGSFIGGWLTAWIQRNGLTGAVSDLGRKQPVNAKKQPTPLEPEPTSVSNLRVYANYLTPRTGLLSPDTWTLIAVYLRNLMLNWLVFLPAIMTALMFPRIWAKLVVNVETYPHPYVYLALGLFGVVTGLVSLGSILANLPSVGNLNWKRGTILILVVCMLCLTAVLLGLYWIGFKNPPASTGAPKFELAFWQPFLADALSVLSGHKPSWPTFVLVGALIPAGPLLFLTFQGGASNLSQRLLSIALVFAGGGVTGIITYAALHGQLLRTLAYYCGVNYELLYSSLAVPFILLVLMVGGTLVAGFSSRFSTAEDQEWWARCGAWTLITTAAWAVVSLLVMFGPLFLMNLSGLFSGNKFHSTKSVIATIVGIISGAITLLGGFSSKTPANKEEASDDLKPKILSVATSIAAAIFAVFIVILLVWLTDWILLGIYRALINPDFSANEKDSIHFLSIWIQLFTMALLFVVAAIAGYLINTNRFSLHYYWRNRMVRAYLGASNPARDDVNDQERVANHFTGFAESDSLRMSELSQRDSRKLFHIINIALNLAGGEKLEWQDRKAESFTVSPLHCGSYWLGYRSSADYARGAVSTADAGKPTGISLGTAVAISGAAASPNMGYMMTSPIVRFLMTLFNIRLGFWLGNPGLRGNGRKPTFDHDSPTQSVRPIVAEALGMTDGKSPYVYLSDGGHFENFGLYEMVLRRCRLIVVSDASTDTDYTFDSLGMAIRQIRVDFGVPIDIKKMSFGRTPKHDHDYCAVGKIRYSCVDKTNPHEGDELYDGILIYLKPTLCEDEPRDVLNYHSANPTFPEETIADQWFSEAQFESYRALGNHMIERICQERVPVTSKSSPFEKFADQARAHMIRRPRP